MIALVPSTPVAATCYHQPTHYHGTSGTRVSSVKPMTAFLLFTALILLAMTLLPISRSRRWYIRALDFPRVQVSVLCVIWIVAYSLMPAEHGTLLTVTAIVMVAVLIYQSYWIFPNTQIHPVEVEPYLHSRKACDSDMPCISLLTCNVLMHNRHAETLIDLVHKEDPDILITLESDQWWQDQLDVLVDYPHRLACPLDNLYGMHVYSKLELVSPVVEYLVEDDKPSMNMQVKIAQSPPIQLHIAHPAPPAPGENDESIERDVELLAIARVVAGRTGPVIVAGDLNDVAWSPTTRLFREISGLKDLRVGRGLYNTFNANHWFIRWPLDHVFVSRHFRLVSMKRLPHVGSDHYPLLVELALDRKLALSEEDNGGISEPELLTEILDTDTARQASLPD